MNNNIKVKLQDTGISSLTGGYSDLLTFQPDKFIIGSEAGFDPTDQESIVRGDITFVSGSENMKFKYIDGDKSLRLMLVIPENADNIVVGNILMYSVVRGMSKPVAMLVLPETITKTNPTSNITDVHYRYPGNRLVINVTIKYVDVDELDIDYSVNVLTPNFANIPYFGLDSEVPSVSDNPHSQFVVNKVESLSDLPAFVTKSSDNAHYFASPLFQNVDSPKFGILNSFEADINEGERIRWVWGQLYATSDSTFKGSVGGVGYTDDIGDVTVIGGLSY